MFYAKYQHSAVKLCVHNIANKTKKATQFQTKSKLRGFLKNMAESVGFEPTCPFGQLHFECSSL